MPNTSLFILYTDSFFCLGPIPLKVETTLILHCKLKSLTYALRSCDFTEYYTNRIRSIFRIGEQCTVIFGEIQCISVVMPEISLGGSHRMRRWRRVPCIYPSRDSRSPQLPRRRQRSARDTLTHDGWSIVRALQNARQRIFERHDRRARQRRQRRARDTHDGWSIVLALEHAQRRIFERYDRRVRRREEAELRKRKEALEEKRRLAIMRKYRTPSERVKKAIPMPEL